MNSDRRRTYYDHEPAYASRRAQGCRGWSITEDDGAYDRVNEFLARNNPPAPATVLDTGCGGGELCIRLASREWKAVGFDFSETAVQLATENAGRSGSNARFVRADCVEPWPFPCDAFDLILDNHVMHCLLDERHRAAYLENAYRVLKPGGVMFSTNMSAEGCLNHRRHDIDPETGVNGNRTRIWVSKARMLDEIAHAGLQVKNCERHSPNNQDESGDELVVEAIKQFGNS